MELMKDYAFTGNDFEGRRELLTLRDLTETVLGFPVTVPKGSFSDGASTPAFVDNFLGFDPLNTIYLRAAIFHDYLYRSGTMTRVAADIFFFALIMREPRPKYKKLFFAIIMFAAVRLCGKRAYDRYNCR